MTHTEDGLIADRQEQREEAAKRMRYLELGREKIEDFERDGTLWVSMPGGYAAKADADRDKALAMDLIRSYEARYNCTLYHIIRTQTAFGLMDSCLMVSRYADEWAEDWDDLMAGYAVAQVFNRSFPELSEAGTIGFRRFDGGLTRVE